MADNVAQQIKNLSDEIARLDKGLEDTKKLTELVFDKSKNIGDAMSKSFQKGNDAAKETRAALKELLKTITDNFGSGKELKLAIGIEKDKLRHDIADAEDKIRQFGKKNSQEYVSQIKTYQQQLTQLTDFERTFANINKVINGDNGKQMSEISKQRVKDNKEVKKIQEETTAALQKRIELEERLKTLKPNAKAWRETKAEIETVNKEVQNYLARMGSLGTAGARQLKAYEKAGLITNADKTQLALERQQIDLLRQRMQAEEQLNRLLLQRNNATLAGKTVSPKVADSISRLQERIDTIDKQRIGSYQNFTQVSLQRIEGMWQNHETALTNIKTQGAQSRQRILDRQTADEQKAIEQQRKLAQQYSEIESLRNQALGGKKYGELNKTELAQWQNFSTLLADVKKQMDAIESKHPGSLLKGQSLQSTDALLQQTKENIRQRDIESKRQAAAEEKKIERELVEEAKRAAKEKSDAEKQRLEIERENLRNWQAANKAATQEADRLARVQAKARSAEAKQTFKRTDSESVSNLKRQAEIKQQIARIDHERQLRAKTNSQISTQQAEAERKSYSALQSELSKLILQQKERERLLRGTTAQASTKIGGYADRLQVQEAQRYRQELEKIRKQQEEIRKQQEKNHRGLEDMLPTLRRLASAFGVAFSVQGLVQFGKKLVETRGEFELQQVALRSILQNKQLADEIWDKTMQAALQSPFTAMQLTKYTKQLAAYRIETDKLFDTTKRLADVSAGLGVDMQRLILAYGQVKAANYLRASEIRQFTEAGVNILGELSAYLTEVKGQAVTTAQVMDMVQKRMIRFEDVEEIFKRLTNEGGVFYNMQYIQSQTVKGQINKLHDAYDQMLNSIGKSNEGVLKGTVSLMLNIVQNWREWKTILDSIAFPAITVALIRFGKGLFAANAATIATDKSFKFLTRSGAKLNVQLKALSATLKAHPLFLIASIVFTAGAALINHAKAVNAVNKEYDELNGRLLETQHKMSSYEDKIKQNNETIKDSSKSQKEHNEAQKDNARMLGELKRDYPDVANGMSIANNGIISMTNSMKGYNAQLRLQIQLNERAKASFFNQSLKKDAQQFDESINKQQSNLAKYTTKAERAYKKIENFLASGKKGVLSDKELRDAMQKLQRMAAATSVEEYEKAYVEYAKTKVNAGRQGLVSLSKALGSGFGFKSISGDRELQSNRDEIRDEIKDDYIYFGRYLREIALLSEDWNGQFALSTEEFISKNKDLLQNMLYTVKKDGTKEIGELGYVISEAFMDAASVSMTEQGQQEIIDELINQFKEKYGLDVAFGVRTKSSERLPDEGAEDKVLTLWRNRIKLIEEMNKKYKDLSKSVYGYAKSEQKVRGEYGLAWLAAGMPFEMSEIDFTTEEGVAEALAKFRKLIPPKLFAELEKEISGRKATIELDAQVRIREDFGRQMEEAFGNYELTLDLQKLNLPSDVLSDLFDLETVDLSDLRRRVTTFYNELAQEGNVDRDDMKSIEGYIKKIDGMERKQQQERIKDYAKFLEYELSERAKISMEYARKIAQVQIEKFSDDEAENLKRRQKIIDGLNKEKDEKLAKQDWEDFKSMDVYVQMMEDLEKHGTVALRTMREELEKIRKNAKNLSPRALKEVVSAIEKIREIELNRSDPFRGVSEAREDVKNALKAAGVSSKAELYAEADAAEKKLVSVQQEKREVDEIVAAKKKEKELTEDIAKLAKKDVIKDVLSNDKIKDKMVALTDLMNEKQKEANDIARERETLEKEILKLSREQSRLIDEESKEDTSAARKEEIKTRLGAIGNRLDEINGLIDTKKVGENIAKGIVNEIYRYIQAKGELSGLSPELLSDSRGENEQKELSDREKKLQEIQEKYQAAINAIDTYNKQVARLMVFVDTWTGKVQELWSSISELSSAYEGEFGDWVSRWGGVVDTTFQQVSKLSKAFADFQAVRADYLKSATKKVADKASSAVDNMEKASETAQTQANTAATQANTLAKIENATASNLAAMGNSAVGTSAAAATPAVATFGATLLMAMGWVGLIMAALEALFAIIKAIAGAHDSQLDKQIEDQQKRIDDLTDAYARLERQIERTWSSVSYMQTYEQQVQNIREQISAMEAQMRAEEAKKNTDENAVRQYQRDIQDAYDQLEELEQKSIEVFGGIGEEGYRSAAEGFVEAWKSAFLETGDGLQGLQDHFDEFLQDWFAKQATMLIARKYLDTVFDQIDAAVQKNGNGGVEVMWDEIQGIMDTATEQFPAFSAELEEFFRRFGGFGEGSLSGLAAGIQGMTEEQANILEAYWNSVRMYTASIDGNVSRIAEMLGVGGPSTNPMLAQLQNIANNTAFIPQIYDLLNSVRRNNGNGQGFVTYGY